MISYHAPNNDFYVFFEETEVTNTSNKLKGQYVNPATQTIGNLELEVTETINDLTQTNGTKDSEGNFTQLQLKIKPRIWQQLKQEGSVETHEQPGHTHLIDTSRLEELRLGIFTKMNYQQLVHIRESFK